MTRRLIEEWLPIAELGVESVRERTPMTPYPAPNRLHVWWARRPLVAARAAVLASILPSDADRKEFMDLLGIHGDPIAAKKAMEKAKRSGVRIANAYGYQRAFQHCLTGQQRSWLLDQTKKLGINQPTVLDPTAGGGAVPLEAMRMGCRTIANDLNPVSVFVQKATYEWSAKFGRSLLNDCKRLFPIFRDRLEERLAPLYPQRQSPEQIDCTYLWARTIYCPYCAGKIPLSPNWKLTPDGIGIRLIPDLAGGLGDKSRACSFEVVSTSHEQSPGTVKGGGATCPYHDCGRVIDGDQIKEQAQSRGMGEQLFAIVYKKRIITGYTKATSKKPSAPKIKWEQGYRAPSREDDNSAYIDSILADKMPEWEALDVLPNESIPFGFETNIRWPLHLYGIKKWSQFFTARQLLCHGTAIEIFREIFNEEVANDGQLSDMHRSSLGYLAVAISRLIDWNSRQCTWELGKLRMAHTFAVHAFPIKWSFAEMSPLVEGLGYDWSLKQTAKCLDELIDLIDGKNNAQSLSGPLFPSKNIEPNTSTVPPVILSCQPGEELAHIQSGSVDAVVMDPPYYEKVMYAELSDFFYVWLKRSAGLVFPDLFASPFTDKDKEAVANPSRFDGRKDAKALAGLDYQEKMSSIFSECRRVLKADGIMTVMFTHKATGAWDALAKGLIDAGFVITASWPINTEAESSLHIRDKATANSTILLVCRPRPEQKPEDGVQYWEDLEPRVKAAVRKRIEQFQAGGIRGVDLYLSCFGPALEEFSLHWPIKRGQPKPIEEQAKRGGRSKPLELEMTPEEKAELPYRVTPEDALDSARREVKAWRMERLTSGSRRAQLDPLTEWFVLAWDAFQAPQFPYDEALRLARVVGLDLDKDVVGVLAEKKSSDLVLWDSSTRATKGKLGAPDGSRSWIDAIHHCAHRARSIDLNAAKQLLDDNGLANSPVFLTALEAVLEVLPLSARYTGFDPVKAAAPAASDFEALENLRRLALAEQVPAPKQLELVLAELAEA
jgi:putative DNA methylase